jgi:peptidoglycan/xylan/chitin deacetylase (PgdA/CDA1 family)
LGRYLFREGIRATFFIVGRHAEGQGDVLAQLSAWGHHLGNHTYSHPGLVALAEAGGDVVDEIGRTDRLIRPHVRHRPIFLRAPYGNWRKNKISKVAKVLNASGRFPDYVGPINWDISAADYNYWLRGTPADQCAAAYLKRIGHIGRGIILLHDSSEYPTVRRRNGALQATRLLVPALKAQGYRFVGLDQVPQIRGASTPKGDTENDFFALISRALGVKPVTQVMAELFNSVWKKVAVQRP